MKLPILLLALSSLAAATPAANGSYPIPEGLQQSDWQSIRSAHEAWKHRFGIQADGSVTARHPAMGWRMYFDETGFIVQPSDDSWKWGLELVITESSRAPEHAKPNINREHPGGNSTHRSGEPPMLLYYRRTAEITEWFINDSRGLEQGWTLSAPAEIRLRVRGNLPAQVSPQSVSFGGKITYSGLKAWDANGKTVSTSFESAPEGFFVRYDDRLAKYPITIDPIAQQAYLKASNTGASDFFGISVAISGHTVVVGARGEDSNATGVNGDEAENSSNESGAAYVFTRSGTTWSQQAYLKASNTGANDNFGRSVAISGDTVVVGAPGESSSATGINGDQADNFYNRSGAAYIFTRSGTTWSQQAYLKASNTGANDEFGVSVAISGDSVVVGANYEDSNATGINGNQADNSLGLSGAAYVYTRNDNTWSQQAYLKASNTGASDQFGFSVAISADTVVVGASGEDSNATGIDGNQSDNGSSSSGAAYVFTRSGNTWIQQAYLKAGNTGLDDWFGVSVAISGDTVVVGALFEDSNATGINGNQANNSSSSSGAAYIFTRSGATWSQQAYLKASNTGAGDQFGVSVAISGDTVVVGADYEYSSATGVNGSQADNFSTSFSGAAYVFTRSDTTWNQQAYLKASNTGASDFFGSSVAISGDTVIIGATGEDSNATGVNGYQSDNGFLQSGAAYIFTGFAPGGPPAIETQPASTTIANGSSTTLSVNATGTVPLTYQWFQGTSGNTTTPVGFNSPTFTTPSLYVTTSYWVMVSNGHGSVGSQTATVFVNPPATTYWEAVQSAGVTGNDAQPNAFPFGDGVPNLIKYAFNLNLAGPDRRTMVSGGTAGLPHISRVSGASPVFRIEYLRRIGAGLNYLPQTSTSLEAGDWEPVQGTPQITPIDTSWERVIHEVTATADRMFGRVGVELGP